MKRTLTVTMAFLISIQIARPYIEDSMQYKHVQEYTYSRRRDLQTLNKHNLNRSNKCFFQTFLVNWLLNCFSSAEIKIVKKTFSFPE